MREVLVVIGVGGMGEAIARRWGAGREVLLADFSTAALERVATALRGEGYSVTVRETDVSSRDSVSALAECASSLGPVAHLVHTAGLSPVQASAEAILQVDLLGVANSLEEFGKVIESGGSGVVISSMAGWLTADRITSELESELASTSTEELLSLPVLSRLQDSGAAYGIAKRGNQLRVQAASVEWGRRGARVNSVSPGVISTPMGQEEISGDSGTAMRKMIADSGTGRIGTTTDIAGAVAFLLGPDASFITGTDLLVDGGVVGSHRVGAGAMHGDDAGAPAAH